MCDYSLETANNREAVQGDVLVLAALGACGTHGFVAPAQKHLPVCIQDGTRLMLRISERMRETFGLSGVIVAATFHQRDYTAHNPYRDGVIFDEKDPKQHFSLQDFEIGAGATVELLPGQTATDLEPRRSDATSVLVDA